MKIQPLLLQTIGIALVAAACNPAQQPAQEPLSVARQQHQIDTPQQRLLPSDTAIDSTSSRAITPDYCPPCGRG